jgi:hypothetical protein
LSITKLINLNIGGLYETIASTLDLDGKPHAAPMGALFLSHDSFIMRSYGETVTLKNLKASKRGALNVVDDVTIFFDCVFKPSKLSFKWLDGIPVLRNARAWLVFELGELVDRGQYYEICCRVISVKAFRTRPRPFCRAEASLLEALIHYTRLKHYARIGREVEVRELKRLIDHSLSVVERTGWPRLKRIAKDLREKASSLSGMP